MQCNGAAIRFVSFGLIYVGYKNTSTRGQLREGKGKKSDRSKGETIVLFWDRKVPNR